jgi:hypothetical protein
MFDRTAKYREKRKKREDGIRDKEGVKKKTVN